MNEIEKYYNKFNEDKRLKSRHGIVEFTTTMHFINKYLKPNSKIIDIGAGTGRYSKELYNMGFDITAVELVKKNLSVLKQNAPNVKAYQCNALNLKKFKDQEFDFCLLLGPMYHLHKKEEKLKALQEAKRITKKGGVIFVAHLLNDYAIIRHGFMDNNIIKSMTDGKVDNNFNIYSAEEDLYSYVNLNQIQELNTLANLKRLEIISPDGPTDYIRQHINKLSKEEFDLYLNYIKQTASDQTKIGASSHVVDILQV